MSFILYMLAGFFSGLLGGMGMGGGTVLIPVLTIFLGVEQHIAQSANLIAFLPMSLISLQVHKGKGLLKTQGILSVIIPSVLTSIAGGLFAVLLPSEILKKLFGAFLIALAIKGLVSVKLTAKKS